MDGGILNYRIESREPFKVGAIIRKFNIENRDEIPAFWKELRENGLLSFISDNYKTNLLGICIGTQNDCEYRYGIGVEVNNKELANLEIIEVPKSTWVVFKCEGQDAKSINKLWSRIYIEFFGTSNYRQSMDIDFELYDAENTEIWIPVDKE